MKDLVWQMFKKILKIDYYLKYKELEKQEKNNN